MLSTNWAVGIWHGRCFDLPMLQQDRYAATLPPIIQQHVQPGTVVYSDEWQAYLGVSSAGYTHSTVAKPLPSLCWSSHRGTYSTCGKLLVRVKAKLKRMHGTTLDEFMWRVRFGKTHMKDIHCLDVTSSWPTWLTVINNCVLVSDFHVCIWMQ